jgi:hypothetical protein
MKSTDEITHGVQSGRSGARWRPLNWSTWRHPRRGPVPDPRLPDRAKPWRAKSPPGTLSEPVDAVGDVRTPREPAQFIRHGRVELGRELLAKHRFIAVADFCAQHQEPEGIRGRSREP